MEELMPSDLVPAARFSTESQVKGSRFISTIGPASSITDAKGFISDISQLYSDATHNVPAYLIGFGSSTVAHSNDDGEPSGTAGRPALSVLIGSGLGDVVIVITRYYGGTKLGTGGLVKAYTNAARDAVLGVPKARKVVVTKASLTCPYNVYERAIRSIKAQQGFHLQEDFAGQVRIRFSVPTSNLEPLQHTIIELTNGKFEIEILEKEGFAFLPISNTEENTTND
jgi:uncharacterized YigZ family protein